MRTCKAAEVKAEAAEVKAEAAVICVYECGYVERITCITAQSGQVGLGICILVHWE